jgi:NADPH:quinone reductase-like Zn-dependent oxidoreductase
VKRFREGDQVYGMDIDGRGAHAQYTCRSEEGALAKKPANMTYEESAAVPHGTLTALTLSQGEGEGSERTASPDQRCFRSSGHSSGTTGQVLWGRGHQRVRYRESGVGEIAGSR